jgi:4a-hydroxytetrahydrobiopterin dehydratase
MPTPLSPAVVTAALATLPGWNLDGTRLAKTFVFRSFPEAFSFMTRVAFAAEAINHHPDWRNVYNRVTVRLSTHDAGDAITDKDLTLARAIQEISWVE